METENFRCDIDGSQVRSEFGIRLEAPLLSIVARLNYWKGHTLLLKALAKVKVSVPDIRLLVVGEDDPAGHPGGGSHLDELKALANELGLADNVIFTGFRRDIPEILAASDIFAMPSFEEPFGMVYLEAMAMKKPIIALDNGGAREVVENGRSGLLSLPDDIDGLAHNILELIRNPAQRATMGEYGYMQVHNFYTPQRMADDMEAVYRQILEVA